MDPVAITGIAYAAETALEGAAAYVIQKPTLPLKAHLKHLNCVQSLPRSSHSFTAVKGRAYLFGGEIQPRQPVSNDIETLTLPSSTDATTLEYCAIPAKATSGEDVPQARVGHTAAAARDRIFVFGGRGGADMKALPENGRLWVFDTQADSWTFLDPPPSTEYPCPRSYHASTASDDGNVIFIHAGCASTGDRLRDTWAFYLDEGKWTQLADAPTPARGGPSLTFAQRKLWRFGGFDGKTELGGQLDHLEVPTTTGMGTTSVAAKDYQWQTLPFSFETTDAKSDTVPGNRSLAAFHPINTGLGRHYLLLALGEAEPSSKGHEGTGTFWQDVWCYQLPTSGATGAGVKDAIRDRLPGMGTTKGQWSRVEITGMEVGAEENEGGKWTGRGWFGSSEVDGGMLIWGGLDERNERLGDGWMIVIE